MARQPIFDRNKDLYGYELLFRSGETNGFPDIDGNTATTSLLSSSFFTIGIDKIAGGKIAFINFTADLIRNKTPMLFPREKLMVEILENVEPDENIVDACRELRQNGYQLALDDFVYARKFDSLIAMSDIIKVDFRITPPEKIEEMLPFIQQSRCKLLAEKVETYEEFHAARELGFHYFQGYFFSRPEVIRNRDMSTSQLTMMQLISAATQDDFDIGALENIIAQDVSISYKLINYLNSPHFGRLQPISSIRQAISFLGENGFKLFVSLIAASNLAQDKPQELIRLSIIRARFLERVGQHTGDDSNELFLVGLFSLIDAMLDRKMDDIFSRLPLSENITATLLKKDGPYSHYLRLVETYEAGNWIAFKYARKRTGLPAEKVVEFYIDALKWADSFDSLSGNQT